MVVSVLFKLTFIWVVDCDYAVVLFLGLTFEALFVRNVLVLL